MTEEKDVTGAEWAYAILLLIQQIAALRADLQTAHNLPPSDRLPEGFEERLAKAKARAEGK